MITFSDGPAHGIILDLRRAPKFLRVVINAEGEVDALDQLHAYELVGKPSRYHVCRTPRRLSGWHIAAQYRHVPQQPSDATMRDTAEWQAWCLAQRETPQ